MNPEHHGVSFYSHRRLQCAVDSSLEWTHRFCFHTIDIFADGMNLVGVKVQNTESGHGGALQSTQNTAGVQSASPRHIVKGGT
jgi:hypothetical protein